MAAAEPNSVTLVTPTYWRDLALCELLCETVDRWIDGFDKHYLIVADDDQPLFAKLEGVRREVIAASELLPRWLRPLPAFLRRGTRRYWWSLRTKPVSGWHVQQLLKLAAAATLDGPRFCIVDSDVAFFRRFDLAAYRRPHPIPAYYAPAAVTEDTAMHAAWVKSTHRLLGLPPPAFPADDFIGHVIFWDRASVRSMLDRIEKVTAREWPEALCRVRDFSEYMLYGFHQRRDAEEAQRHYPSTASACISYWEPRSLDEAGIRRLLDAGGAEHVAFSAASLSGTPVERVRRALADRARGDSFVPPVMTPLPAG
jgi:hypothetical protein